MTPSVDEARASEGKLDVLRSIRSLLVEEGGLDLDTNFPIVEMKGKSHASNHHLGYCRGKHSSYVTVSPDRKVSTVNKTHKIEMRLVVTIQRQGDDCETIELSLLALIPTFLHELAHSITPGVLTYGSDPDSTKGKKSRRWYFDAHCDLFYQNFAKILRVAEELGIFALPKRKSKLSHRSLLRFDAIDVSVASSDQIGSSPRFDNGAMAAGQCRDGPRKEAPVYVLEFKGKKKLLRLEPDQNLTKNWLLSVAKQRLRCRPQRILSQDGNELADEDLALMARGSLLVFV